MRPKNLKYDAILFDAGGTLLGTNVLSEFWYEQFFVDACHESGYSRTSVEQVKEALSAAASVSKKGPGSFWHDEHLIQCFWEHTYSTVFKILCPDHNADDLAKHYISRFRTGEFTELFPDTLNALACAQRCGLVIGLVSNFGSYLSDMLRRLEIAHYFEFQVISAKEGCAKPSRDIFQIAHKHISHIKPSRILFVGDHPIDDYEGSAAYGFTPILLDRRNTYHQQTQTYRTIATLAELENIYRV